MPRKVNFLNLSAIGFLVLSLVTITVIASNPNIRQLIGASAGGCGDLGSPKARATCKTEVGKGTKLSQAKKIAQGKVEDSNAVDACSGLGSPGARQACRTGQGAEQFEGKGAFDQARAQQVADQQAAAKQQAEEIEETVGQIRIIDIASPQPGIDLNQQLQQAQQKPAPASTIPDLSAIVKVTGEVIYPVPTPTTPLVKFTGDTPQGYISSTKLFEQYAQFLPPTLAKVVSQTGDLLSLTQDPSMAATIDKKLRDCYSQFGQSTCDNAFAEASKTKETGVVFYKLENPYASTQELANQVTAEKGKALELAVSAYGIYNLSSVFSNAYSAATNLETTYNSLYSSLSVSRTAQTIGSLASAALPTYATYAALSGDKQAQENVMIAYTVDPYAVTQMFNQGVSMFVNTGKLLIKGPSLEFGLGYMSGGVPTYTNVPNLGTESNDVVDLVWNPLTRIYQPTVRQLPMNIPLQPPTANVTALTPTDIASSVVSNTTPTTGMLFAPQLNQVSPIALAANNISSILNLPDANNPAGWTLGTYGNQIQPTTSLGLQDNITNNAPYQNFLQITSQAKAQIAASSQPGTAMQTLNPVIDQLVATGVNEYDAITLVANRVSPPYAHNPTAEELARINSARTLEGRLTCPSLLCRNYIQITDEIAANRGLETYHATFHLTNAGGSLVDNHTMTAVKTQSGGFIFIDATNNLTLSLNDALRLYEPQGEFVVSLNLDQVIAGPLGLQPAPGAQTINLYSRQPQALAIDFAMEAPAPKVVAIPEAVAPAAPAAQTTVEIQQNQISKFITKYIKDNQGWLPWRQGLQDRITKSSFFNFNFGQLGSENLPEITLQKSGNTFSFEPTSGKFAGKKISLTADTVNSWIIVKMEGSPDMVVRSGSDITTMYGERVAFFDSIGVNGTPLLRQYPRSPSFIERFIKDNRGWLPWLRTPTTELAVPETVPADLTKVTVAPDGDVFVSVKAAYQSESSPALVRRVTDIQNQVANLDSEKIAQIIYEARYTDGLTGLANRTGFVEGLGLEIGVSTKNGTDLTVITMDLRRFKGINDKLGHVRGDDALKMVGDLLKKNARATDLAVRISGDEFALILPQTNEAQAQALVRRILTDLESQKALGGADDLIQRINIDYGIKQWSETDTVDDFLSDLDKLMYEQKRGVGIPTAAESVFGRVSNGSFTTGVGFGPFGYAAGGIGAFVVLDNQFDWEFADRASIGIQKLTGSNIISVTTSLERCREFGEENREKYIYSYYSSGKCELHKRTQEEQGKISKESLTPQNESVPELSFLETVQNEIQKILEKPPKFGISMATIGNFTVGHYNISQELLQKLYENYYIPSPDAFLASGTLYGGQETAIATIMEYRKYMLDQMNKGYVLEASGLYGYHPELAEALKNFIFLYNNSGYDHSDILLDNESAALYSLLRDSNAVNGQFVPIVCPATPPCSGLNANQNRIYYFSESSLTSIANQSKMTPEDALASGQYVGIVATKSANDLGRTFLLYKNDPLTGQQQFVGVVLVGDYAKRADWTGTGATTSDVFFNNPLGFRQTDGQQWGFDLTQDLYNYFGGTGGPVTNIIAVEKRLSETSTAPTTQTSGGSSKSQYSPAESANFDYYNQTDPNWQDPDFNCAFSKAGCAITVDAMLLSTYTNQEVTPKEVKDKWFSNPAYDCGSYYGPHALVLEANGFEVEDRRIINVAEIAATASYDNPIVLGVTISGPGDPITHWTIAVGTSNKGELIFEDPYFGSGVTLPVNYVITDQLMITPPKI